jgi:predicted SAM-dependent methyltransferase
MNRLLNVGCGGTHHRDWVNLDLVPESPSVMAHDVRRGLPFPDASFDACYSSHLLEHLDHTTGVRLLRELKRVLVTEGIIRIAVPDLEQICRNYLEFLDRVVSGEREYEFRYDYTRLELLDQLTRDASGGELGRLWQSEDLHKRDLAFIAQRHGTFALDLMERARNRANASIVAKLASTGAASKLLNRVRVRFGELIVRGLFGQVGPRALRTGLFRESGEVHRTMYDRFNLRRVLLHVGFTDVTAVTAAESRIPDFGRYELDVHGGSVRKPDSLFMEAVSR